MAQIRCWLSIIARLFASGRPTLPTGGVEALEDALPVVRAFLYPKWTLHRRPLRRSKAPQLANLCRRRVNQDRANAGQIRR